VTIFFFKMLYILEQEKCHTQCINEKYMNLCFNIMQIIKFYEILLSFKPKMRCFIWISCKIIFKNRFINMCNDLLQNLVTLCKRTLTTFIATLHFIKVSYFKTFANCENSRREQLLVPQCVYISKHKHMFISDILKSH
jgi:hypothetical protein